MNVLVRMGVEEWATLYLQTWKGRVMRKWEAKQWRWKGERMVDTLSEKQIREAGWFQRRANPSVWPVQIASMSKKQARPEASALAKWQDQGQETLECFWWGEVERSEQRLTALGGLIGAMAC